MASDPGLRAPTSRRRPLIVICLGLLVSVATVACSGDDSSQSTQTTTTVAPSTTTTTEPSLEQGRQVEPLYYEPSVGDCFDRRKVFGPDNKQTEVILRLDCQLPHEFEIFATVEFPLPEDGDTAWPGDEALRDLARSTCPAAFETYVGAPYETSVLEMGYLLPPEDNFGVNQLIGCSVYDPVPDRTAGTLQGSAR